MLIKIVNPALVDNTSVNTDHETSLPGQLVAVVKVSTDPKYQHALDAIQYSYTHESSERAAPIKGGISIYKGDKLCWDADISDFTGVLNLYIPCPADKELKIVLKAGGANVIGKLNVQSHLEQVGIF